MVREHALVSYFHDIIRRMRSFDYLKPSYVFSFGMHCCKPLLQHLVHLY
jgi:hypothetical protein